MDMRLAHALSRANLLPASTGSGNRSNFSTRFRDSFRLTLRDSHLKSLKLLQSFYSRFSLCDFSLTILIKYPALINFGFTYLCRPAVLHHRSPSFCPRNFCLSQVFPLFLSDVESPGFHHFTLCPEIRADIAPLPLLSLSLVSVHTSDTLSLSEFSCAVEALSS